MCPSLMEGDNLDPWILFLKSMLDMPVPPDLGTITDNIIEIERR